MSVGLGWAPLASPCLMMTYSTPFAVFLTSGLLDFQGRSLVKGSLGSPGFGWGGPASASCWAGVAFGGAAFAPVLALGPQAARLKAIKRERPSRFSIKNSAKE